MGSDQSSLVQRELYTPGEYQTIENINDQRYGSIEVLRNNETSQLACRMSQTLQSDEFYQQKVQHCAGRITLKHENLVNFINYNAEKNEEFCSTFWRVQMLYEYLNQDLREQISIRSASNLRFKEGELWYLLQSCVNGLSYLKKSDIIHGDIRPAQVLLTNDGRVKLGEHFQQNKPLTAYQQFLMDLRKSEFYIAPQLFESLRKKDYNHQYDAGANDIFALGMTMLEAAVLTSTDICYNIEDQYTFNPDKLRELLYVLSTLYSSRFHSIVSRMLIESDQDRLTLEDLKSELDLLTADELFKRDIGINIPLVELGNPQVIQTSVIYSPQQQYVVEEPVQEETVKRAAHNNASPNGVMTQQQNVMTPGEYDLQDIDDRIAKILAMSRETVRKYGGDKAYQAYEDYERSQGYDPVRQSQLHSPTYKSHIYEVNQQYIEQSQAKKSPESVKHQEQYSPSQQQQYQQPIQTVSSYQAYIPSNSQPDNLQKVHVSPQEYKLNEQQSNDLVDKYIKQAPEPQNNHVTSSPYQPITHANQVENYPNGQQTQQPNTHNSQVQQQQQKPSTHNSYAQPSKLTSEDLDSQIQRSLNKSKQIENMIKTSQKDPAQIYQQVQQH